MSGNVAAGTRPAASAWRMYRSMVGIGLVCGVLLVAVFQLTRPIIERNRAEALERAIFRVLPDARTSESFVLRADGGFDALDGKAGGRPVVHAGYGQDGRLVGFAIEAAGMGYQDTIRLIWGYSFEHDAIVGIQVLDSKETPGLGDRIQSDPAFLGNFDRLDVRLAADGSGLAHEIVAVKHGTKSEPWQIDAITGATISSNAIAKILDNSAERVVPALRAHLDRFREAGS